MRARVLLLLLTVSGFPQLLWAQAPPDISHLRLPPHFVVELLAQVPGARSMALGAKGTLFVGTQRSVVYAVKAPFSGHPEVLTIASGLKMPNGVAWRDGALFIAEPQRILRLAAIEDHLDNPGEPQPAVSDLPYKNPMHAWKYIAFGPDGKLYVPLGMPCNICTEPGLRRVAAHECRRVRP